MRGTRESGRIGVCCRCRVVLDSSEQPGMRRRTVLMAASCLLVLAGCKRTFDPFEVGDRLARLDNEVRGLTGQVATLQRQVTQLATSAPPSETWILWHQTYAPPPSGTVLAGPPPFQAIAAFPNKSDCAARADDISRATPGILRTRDTWHIVMKSGGFINMTCLPNGTAPVFAGQ